MIYCKTEIRSCRLTCVRRRLTRRPYTYTATGNQPSVDPFSTGGPLHSTAAPRTAAPIHEFASTAQDICRVDVRVDLLRKSYFHSRPSLIRRRHTYCMNYISITRVILMRRLQLRFDLDSTAVRLLIKGQRSQRRNSLAAVTMTYLLI